VGQVKERTVMELARFRAEIPRDFETDRKRAYPKFDSQKNMTEHTKQAAISFCFTRLNTSGRNPCFDLEVSAVDCFVSLCSCSVRLAVFTFRSSRCPDPVLARSLDFLVPFLFAGFRVGRVSLAVPSRSSRFLSIASSSISSCVFFSFR